MQFGKHYNMPIQHHTNVGYFFYYKQFEAGNDHALQSWNPLTNQTSHYNGLTFIAQLKPKLHFNENDKSRDVLW